VIKALRRLTKRRLDVHIYGHHPSKYLDELKRSGTDVVIVHVETEGEDYIKTIQEIRRMGMKAGVAILPTSQVPENISQVLPLISVVVANTVGPAYAGQTFNVAGVQNMKKIHDISHDLGLTLEFAADGSVSSERLPLFLEAGANHFILGTSSLFLGNNLPENARIFQENLSSEIEKMTKR
jgi:pentose-5-phosphate-3-epimerase